MLSIIWEKPAPGGRWVIDENPIMRGVVDKPDDDDDDEVEEEKDDDDDDDDEKDNEDGEAK